MRENVKVLVLNVRLNAIVKQIYFSSYDDLLVDLEPTLLY